MPLFYILLYLIGIIFLLPLNRKIPGWLITSAGFPIGLIIWVLASMILLVLKIPQNWSNLFIIVLIVSVISTAKPVYKKTIQISMKDLGFMITGFLIISILSYIFTNQFYVFATEDSFSIIFHGRVLVESGLVPWSISQFTEWGVIVPVIQMAAGLFSSDYLSGYQTILTVSLIAILFLGMYHELKKYFSLLTSMIVAGAFILVLATKQFLNHSFYIHNNLPASIFLLLAIYSYWKFIRSNEDSWMILGSISITAFSFSRIEGPLYVILIILLVVSIKQPSYKQTLTMIAPYTLIAFAWHIALLLSGGQNQLLSNNNIQIILIALIGLLTFAFFSSKLKPFLSVIPMLILAGLFFGVVLAILVEPEHMITSITYYWQNLVQMFSWGWTWFVVLAFVPFIFGRSEQLPENRFLIHTIGAYILVILLIVLVRIPYRLGETDSSNRLMIQILPVILFTIASNAETIKLWLSPTGITSD